MRLFLVGDSGLAPFCFLCSRQVFFNIEALTHLPRLREYIKANLEELFQIAQQNLPDIVVSTRIDRNSY